MSLLTYDMETELLHWIAVSQNHSGGVDMHSVCRVAFALMASDPEHHKKVKEVNPNPNPKPNPHPHLHPHPHPFPNTDPNPNPKEHAEYRDVNKRAFSNRWFHRFKKRFLTYLTKHTVESYAVGRAQITRTMIDSIYSVLQTVLDAAEPPISASNIWNFDETVHN